MFQSIYSTKIRELVNQYIYIAYPAMLRNITNREII